MQALHSRIARAISLLLFLGTSVWPIGSSAAVLKKDHGTIQIELKTAEDVTNDSGWRPLFDVAGVKAEIRYYSSKRGNLFSIEMDGAAYLDTERKELWFEGKPNAGMANMDFGYELGAELKLILRGRTYDIPLIERDYLFDPQPVDFTPYAFVPQGIDLQNTFSNPSLLSTTVGLGKFGLYLVGLKVGLGWNGVFSNQFGTWGLYTDLTMDDPFSGDQGQTLGRTEKKQIPINSCQVKVNKINAMLFSQAAVSIYPDLRLGFVYLFQTIEIKELEGAQPLAMPYLAAPTMIPAVAVPQDVDFCVCSLKLFYPAGAGWPVYKSTAGDGTALYEVALEATSQQGASYVRSPVVNKACSDTWLTSDPAPAPKQFPIGTNQVNWIAGDKAGAERSLKLSVVVADTTPPHLVAPEDLVVSTTKGKDVVSVDLGEPVVSDISPVAVVNDAPQDGFPVGRTIVTWTATDSYDNRTTEKQKVTVLSADLRPTLPKPPPRVPVPPR